MSSLPRRAVIILAMTSRAAGLSGPRLRQLCIEKQPKGNAVPDAWLAAATIHLGEHLVSFDRDFRKLIGRSQYTLLEAYAG